MTSSPSSVELLKLEFEKVFSEYLSSKPYEFRTLITLYSLIYQIVTKGAQLGNPSSDVKTIKNWCQLHYNKSVDAIYLLRDLKDVYADLSVINNIFAYPKRCETITTVKLTVLETKRETQYKLYNNYRLLFLTDIELCTDVIKTIGKIMFDLSQV